MPKYKFSDIAINSTEKKKPVEEDKYTYIGLEHLDPGTLTVSRWGAEVAPIGEKLVMKKGDVLFGKRRAYQKKVGIAPFDGIFSAHGMVLRPKEDVITKEYFPLFISSDYFLDEAIRISVGSLSPTINWKNLKELEFTIPSIEEQKRVAPVIWAAIDTKNAYKKLLQETDELIKAQFIERFGDPEANPMGWAKVTFEEISELITDGEHATPRRSEKGIYLLSARNVLDHSLSFDDVDYIDQEEYDRIAKRLVPQAGDVLISCSGTVGRVCTVPENLQFQLVRSVALIRFKKEINPIFMEHQISMPYIQTQIDASKSKTSQANLFQGKIKKLIAIIPSVERQNQFLKFVEQSDKSKFELRQAIDEVNLLIKSLVRQELK